MPKKKLTQQQLLAKIQEDADKNLRQVSDEITKTLKKYGYQMQIQQSIVLKKVIPQ